MIYSARPTISLVVNIVNSLEISFVLLALKMWGRTDGRTTCMKIMITTGGAAEWINNSICCYFFLPRENS